MGLGSVRGAQALGDPGIAQLSTSGQAEEGLPSEQPPSAQRHLLGKVGTSKRILGRVTWISQHLGVNKCVAPSLGQEVCRGPAGVDGSGTEGDVARFLVYNELQTPKRWTGWEAGRPESKEAVDLNWVMGQG